MKAFVLEIGLIVAVALNSSAWALSCMMSLDIPDFKTASPEFMQLDAQTRQLIDAQVRQRFDDQTRQQFGGAEIVAEAKVISIGETAQMQWASSQLVEVVVTRYLRAPSTKQAQDRYYITATPDALHVNDAILFFASAEPEAKWQARLVPRDPKALRLIFEIPATWTQRIWHAQGACMNPIYALSDPKTAYLVKFVRQLADDKLAPATLTISFSLAGAPDKEAAEIPLKIEAIASAALAAPDSKSAALAARPNITSAKPSRTVSVTSSGIQLDLPAGRYRLLWPELPGYQPACLSEYEKRNCELDLVAGASVRVFMGYHPTAKITLVPITPAGTPINLLGELEWLRIDAPEPDLAEPSQTIFQRANVAADELDKLDDRYGHETVPGRYQLNWVVKFYAPSLGQYDTCELLRTEKIPVRWRIGAGALASANNIPMGHSVVLAEIPESSRVNLEFTHAQKNGDGMGVSARCAGIENGVSQNSASSLKVAAFRGQQYELKYGCYSCKPRLETVRKLMQADQDLVLELK